MNPNINTWSMNARTICDLITHHPNTVPLFLRSITGLDERSYGFNPLSKFMQKINRHDLCNSALRAQKAIDLLRDKNAQHISYAGQTIVQVSTDADGYYASSGFPQITELLLRAESPSGLLGIAEKDGNGNMPLLELINDGRNGELMSSISILNAIQLIKKLHDRADTLEDEGKVQEAALLRSHKVSSNLTALDIAKFATVYKNEFKEFLLEFRPYTNNLIIEITEAIMNQGSSAELDAILNNKKQIKTVMSSLMDDLKDTGVILALDDFDGKTHHAAMAESGISEIKICLNQVVRHLKELDLQGARTYLQLMERRLNALPRGVGIGVFERLPKGRPNTQEGVAMHLIAQSFFEQGIKVLGQSFQFLKPDSMDRVVDTLEESAIQHVRKITTPESVILPFNKCSMSSRAPQIHRAVRDIGLGNYSKYVCEAAA